MNVSVVIPTFNSAKLIRATLESVLRQTLPADEVLVMDDGSTDDTVAILNSFGPRITVLQQKNQGVAAARNALCARAEGRLIAFLDHDDLWHPGYLEAQCKRFGEHPDAAALFAGHVDFTGYVDYNWPGGSVTKAGPVEVIEPLKFLERYNESEGLFTSMSFCCVPKAVLSRIGSEPFATATSGSDDFYLCNLLPLFGRIVYDPAPLVAYRVTAAAQSDNRVKGTGLAVKALELLEEPYRHAPQAELGNAFKLILASKRRQYAKLLMGAKLAGEARQQLWFALREASSPASFVKSLAWSLLTRLPRSLQPAWPTSSRQDALNARVSIAP